MMNARHLFVFAFVATLTAAAPAQLVGDVDDDGDVDNSDIAFIPTCLAGPLGTTATGSCIALDQPDDTDDVVTLEDVIVVSRFHGPPKTECGPDGVRYWAFASTLHNFATGVSSDIDFETTELCAEPGMVLQQAASRAFVGVNQEMVVSGEPRVVRWAQFGYVRGRFTDPSVIPQGVSPGDVFIALYAEVADASNGAANQEVNTGYYGGPLAGRRTFVCEQSIPTFGVWQFSYEDVPVGTLSHELWSNERGTTVTYSGETMNHWDLMVGTPSNKAEFRNCQYEIGNNGNFMPEQFVDNDIFTSRPRMHQAERVGASRVNIWDVRR